MKMLPFQILWRPVIGGFILQFFFASIILKTPAGFTVFKFLGDNVQTFLSYTNSGTEFVFGKKYMDVFAIKVNFISLSEFLCMP